jgi:hypothetical protein
MVVCKETGCEIGATYGRDGEKAEYCARHGKERGYVNVVSRKCEYTGCSVTPTYGTEWKKPIFCAKHGKEMGCSDVVHPRCIFEECDAIPWFAKQGTRNPLYCGKHAPNGYDDISRTKCMECEKDASYGKIGTKINEYCAEHGKNRSGYASTDSRTCIFPDCSSRASFSLNGKRKREYCAIHIPNSDYIDTATKKCKHQGCQLSASYSNGNGREFCAAHAPSGYSGSDNRKCKECGKRATYGKRGTKIVEYCAKHGKNRNGYTDIATKKCKECTKKASCGYLGYPPEYCGEHKKKGMIYRPHKRCQECKRHATHVSKDKKYRCEEHKEDNDICFITTCPICETQINPELRYCELCANFLGKKFTKTKEIRIKTLLEENNLEFKYDQVVENGCSKDRPDFRIPTNFGFIILEVDENQHRKKNYQCECEVARMKQIFFDIGGEYLVFIRYNPDHYKPLSGPKIKQKDREIFLIRKIKRTMTEKPKTHLSVYYMYFDGYCPESNEPDEIDPYN